MRQKIDTYTPERAALLLSQGYVGAITRGKAESGPRALGNRSLIADPRRVSTKERINGLIKHRGSYQPLAPFCLAEDYDRFFEPLAAEVSLDYMLYAVRCKPLAAELVPAVVHSDDTSRVQLVSADNYPFLFTLLRAFKAVTDVGVLVNTSFNGKGEPIVNTPAEAYFAYKALDLDFLILDDWLIERVAPQSGREL